MTKITKEILKYLTCILICYLIFYDFILPRIIESRSKHLGLLRYSASQNKMVEKDTLFLNGYELYYLKKGTFEGYSSK